MDVHDGELERFLRSMERCIGTAGFVERFYDRFIASHPDVAARFASTDMKRQASMVRASLYQVLRVAQGSHDARAHIDELAVSHSRRGHAIPPVLFEAWLDSLIATARETDPAFDAALEATWRQRLVPVIATMTAAH